MSVLVYNQPIKNQSGKKNGMRESEYISHLNETDKSSIEALNYCKTTAKLMLKPFKKIQAFADLRHHQG